MKSWAFCLVGAMLVGCTGYPAPHVIETVRPATHAGMPLADGQLVLTESTDATGLMFTLIAKQFHPFTHVAILAIENGEPWVYDVSGELGMPWHARPTDNLFGSVTKTRLEEHVGPSLYAEIYDPPEGADGAKMVAFARRKMAEKTPFDPRFDFSNHDRLFCTELVELAIREGGGPHRELEPASGNPSIVRGMRWLGVPTGVVLPAGAYAEEKRRVASYGRLRTRSSARAYFAMKKEIHRRFTEDQRVGFLFSIDGSGRIALRKPIKELLEKASHLFDGDPSATDAAIEAAAQKLADETFGPF